MIESKLYSSTKIRYLQEAKDCPQSDENIEVSSEHMKSILFKNITKIHFPILKMSFYNKKDNTVTLFEAHKVTMRIQNDYWRQVDKYLITSNLTYLKAHRFYIIEDKNTV